MIPKNHSANLKRRAIRKEKERRDKHLRASVKESRRLLRVQYDAPLVELEKPYQRGWMRYLRLTERAKRRPDAELLEELLTHVDHVQLCRKGKFERWDLRRHRWVPKRHRPRRIALRDFLKPKTPSKLYRYFRFTSGIRVVNEKMLQDVSRRRQGATLEVNCEHLFETHVVPYYVTHQKVDLPEVKSRETFLDEWLEQCHGWYAWDRMNGHRVSRWSRYCYLDRQWRLKRLVEAEMRVEMLEFNSRRRTCPVNQRVIGGGTINIVPFGLWARKPLRESFAMTA